MLLLLLLWMLRSRQKLGITVLVGEHLVGRPGPVLPASSPARATTTSPAPAVLLLLLLWLLLKAHVNGVLLHPSFFYTITAVTAQGGAGGKNRRARGVSADRGLRH